MDGSTLEEKQSLKMVGLSCFFFVFLFNLNSGSYIVSIAKTPSKEIGALISSMNFHPAEVPLYLLYKSTFRLFIVGLIHLEYVA